MPDLSINQLPAGSSVQPTALLVVYQNGATQSITGAQLIQFANVEVNGAAAAAAASAQEAEASSQAIQNMGVSAQTIAPGQPAVVDKQVSPDGVVTLLFSIPRGVQGETGPQGVSVTAASVLADGTLQLTLSSGSTLNAGNVVGPQGPQGVQGETGPQGVSIQSVTKTAGTGAPGTSDTYTITLTNGSTFEFQVYNGADGGVTTFNGRSGAVEPQGGDYTAEQVGAIPQVNGAAGQFLGFTAENVVGAVDAPSGGGESTKLRAKILSSAWSSNYAVVQSPFFETGDYVYLMAADNNDANSVSEFSRCGVYAGSSVFDNGYIGLNSKLPPQLDMFVIFTKIPAQNGSGSVYNSNSFWLDEAALTPNSAVLVYSSQTIPAGRMVGDVNGDGKITSADANLASQASTGSVQLTPIQKECADVNGTGSVNAADVSYILDMADGYSPIGQYSRDVLGNWSVNPNYETDEAQFYIDIPASGLTAGTDIALAVQGDGADQIVRVEAMSGAFRVYTKLLPINPLPYKLIQ